ncbi:MAG: hypothetical protein ABI444_04995, partial [Candidatus Kapaibacterium sp.]
QRALKGHQNVHEHFRPKSLLTHFRVRPDNVHSLMQRGRIVEESPANGRFGCGFHIYVRTSAENAKSNLNVIGFHIKMDRELLLS